MKKNYQQIERHLYLFLSGKIFRVMRLSAILLMFTFFQVLASETYSQSTRISVEIEEGTVADVLKTLEQKSEFFFLYSPKMIDVNRKVSITVRNKRINTILDQLFRGTDVRYVIKDRQIVLSTEQRLDLLENNTNTLSQVSQPVKVSGTVTDEDGVPVIGATVVVESTGEGTITDTNGKFTLNVPSENETLIFSFVGMTSQEVQLMGRTSISVTMTRDAIGLEEVVAVGYGTQVRKNLSSSISKVDADKFASAPLPSFEGGLQGRAAGVQVTTSSALAGSAIRVRVRGTSSASANSEPLYVIDGIPVESGEISTSQPGGSIGEWNLQTAANTNVLASLNPADIQSIEILKDASAAAIYGSRGANGVVLITTKTGKPGKTKVSASANFGISDATRRISLLNAEEYIDLAQEAWLNAGLPMERFWESSGVLTDGLTQEEALNTNTDWIDEVLQIGNTQEYNLSVNGGNEKTTFYISANLKDEESILRGNEYKRFGARMNIEHQISKRFRVGSKMMVTHIDDQQVPTSWAGGVGNVTEMLPIWPVYKDDGTFFRLNELHPVASVELRDIHLTNNQILGNWFVKVKLAEGLNFRSELGTNLLYNDDFHYRDGRITSHGRTVSSTVIGSRVSWNFKNILNYKKRIKKHSFDLLAALETQDFTYKSNSMFGDTYFNSALKLPEDAEIQNASYFETGYSFLSYIGRINYNYSDRYLLSLSFRADGSSRFAENNRWGYFPAGSVGYILSEEAFFSPLSSVFNFMKLRASYGIVGNAEIGDYAYYSSYSTTSYDANTGLVLRNLGDDELGWEKTAQLDIGISWEALNGRISGEFDYYNKRTTDLLLPFPVSLMTGVSVITKNVGELSNKGVDIMLNSINIQTGDFTWETNFNFNHNKNKVESLSEELGEGLVTQQGLGSQELYVGYPVGSIGMVEWGGVDPATGEDIYIDSDGNDLLYSEVISQYGNLNDFYDEHKKPMGDPWPDFTGGIDNRFSYKNWYGNFLFTYSAGMNFALGELKRTLYAFGSTKINPHDIVLDRWQEPGDEARVSELNVQGIIWTPTSESLTRNDYLRLKDLTLGYRFSFDDEASVKGLNCYLKFTNLLTFTKAPDYLWDPEFRGVVQSRQSNNIGAIGSYKTTPQAKVYMLGLSVDF